MNTTYWNETCGTSRFYLELRTCVPVSPNLPDNFSCQDQTTLRAGNRTCPSITCTGTFLKNASTMQNCHSVVSKVVLSRGLLGVTAKETAARVSRRSGALRGFQENAAGTGVTQSIMIVSSKFRGNPAPQIVHQVGTINIFL